MKRRFQKITYNELLPIGFGLLFPGIFLATLLDNKILKVVGVVLLVISSAVFGASFKSEDRPKK